MLTQKKLEAQTIFTCVGWGYVYTNLERIFH